MRKLSCRIADYTNVDVFGKFSELLHNTFILKKSYSTRKLVHYFEWGTKNIHFYDVDKQTSEKVVLFNDFVIPKFCRTLVTDEGKVFCIGGRHQDNVCCDWMLLKITSAEIHKELILDSADFVLTTEDVIQFDISPLALSL